MSFAKVFLRACALCLVSSNVGVGQIFTDNFGYSTGNLSTVGSANWVVVDDDFIVNSSNLTYPDYAPDNSSNSLTISSSSTGKAKRLFSAVTSGSLYCSFILNVSSGAGAPAGVDNFVVGFWETAESISLISAAVYVIDNGDGTFDIGIQRYASLSQLVDYSATALDNDIDHLIVIKYTFNGSFSDDKAFLFINPNLSAGEPSPADAESLLGGQSDAANLSRLVINQDGFDGVSATIDAIRLGTSWNDAPLPVQLVNFAATSSRFGVDLKWSTASEINNYGFEIERRSVGSDVAEWSVVGFVQGAGTSNETRDYYFADSNVEPGRYAYRIKQIDMSGAYTYYSAAEVEIGLGPKELALEPNYPNPFNPSTNITFTVPVDGRAALKVYNMLGQEVAVLFDEEAVAGRVYQKTFDASSLPTGVYVSRLEFGGQSVMRKMLFVK